MLFLIAQAHSRSVRGAQEVNLQFSQNLLVFNRRTWYGDEEFDGIPVAMERELRLGHGAKRDEAFSRQLILAIRVDSDGPAGHHS